MEKFEIFKFIKNMAKVRGAVEIDIEKCKGCEICINVCPTKTLKMSGAVNSKGYSFAEMINDNCTGCTNCALVCPETIITVYRKKF